MTVFLRRVALLAGLCLLCLSGQAEMVLADAGKMLRTVICLPEAASRGEIFAARELQRYVGEMTGVKPRLEFGDSIPVGAVVLIGRHPGNRALARELDQSCSSYERYALQVRGNMLQVVAPHAIGLSYGVWDVLEELGVDWLLPTRLGAYVPRMERIVLKDRKDFREPSVVFRSSTNYPESGEDWYIRNGGYPYETDPVTGLNEGVLHALRLRLNTNCAVVPEDRCVIMGAGHSYGKYLPISQYGKDHPEYFSEVNGRRMGPGDSLWQICMTNREGARVFAENACKDIERQLSQGIAEDRILLFVSPNDHEQLCDCPECSKLLDGDGYRSSQVLHFANLVADVVGKRYPKVRVTYYVYHNYGRIPTRELPRKNVYPFITAWTANNSLAVNNSRPLMDAQGNRIFHDVYTWFAKHSGGCLYYPYYGHYLWYTPWPMVTQMGQDIPAMARLGKFLGGNSESHLHWGTQNLNLYLYPKLLWNPQLEVRKVVETYCRKAYGPAAMVALAYLDLVQRKMDQCPYICGEHIEMTEIFTPEVIRECDRLMAVAVAKIPRMDEGTAWRTEVLVKGWHEGSKVARIMQLFRYGNRPECYGKAKAWLDELREFSRSKLGRLIFEKRIVDGVVGGFAAPLQVNLSDIPKGKSVYDDRLLYGSVLKFYATFKHVDFRLWGLYAQPKETATITLPLHAREGVFKKISLVFHGPASGVQCQVKSQGDWKTVGGSSHGQLRALVPAGYLGERDATVRLVYDNGENDAKYLFFSGKLSFLVE